MSSGENPQDQEPAKLIILPASETFDGQERVMSREAYELWVRSTSDSAFCGHPGYVPDTYLAVLDGDMTAIAAELCNVRMWERFGGGYCILDRDAVRVCMDHVREIVGEDPQALAREQEREHENQILAQMAKALVITPLCAACGTPATRIELAAPEQLPAEWDQWPSKVQDSIRRQLKPGQWWFLFKGIAAYNGYGDPIDASRAGRIVQAFRPPLSFAQVHTAGFYDDAGFCEDCDAPYCYHDWHVTESGFGHCPRGHGKSLDWYW